MKHYLFTFHRAFVLSVVFSGILFGTVQARQNMAPKYRPTVIIDIKSLPESTQAIVISSLSKFSKIDEWESTIINNGDSLSKIILDTYGYSATKFPRTTEVLVDLIKEANQLDNPNALKAGQYLRLPLLPSRPFARGAKPELAQVFDTASHSLFVATSKDVMTKPFAEMASEDKSLEEGETWVVRMSPEESEQFLAGLPENIRNEVYSGPTIEVEEANVPGVTDFSTAQPITLSSAQILSSFVANLQPQNVGKYYVLDFFRPKSSQDCTHGDMVVDVAKQALDNYGASQLKDNIKQLQIDFFEDKDGASEIILEYIKSFSSEKIQRNLKKALDNLRSQKKPTPDKKYVPLLYLQALYNTLISKPDTALISSSFYIRFDGYRVLPIAYRSDNKVILLSAVMDDSGSKIEEVETEPQRSFFDGRRDLGVILVGAEKEPGTSFGMISENGDGVSCLGKGAGWGIAGSCITPQKIGTSFSTPSIAIQLMLAKAFWSANTMNITAKDAKTRLLLSSDLNPVYVSRYASGGVTRLEKLLRLNGTFAETKDSRIIDISLGNSYIEVKNKTGGVPHRFVFQRGSMGFCGLQIVDGHTFIFREDAMKWEEVEIEKFSFMINQNGVIVPLTFEEFVNQFKEIVTL